MTAADICSLVPAAPRVAHGPNRSIVVMIEGSGSCPYIATRARLAGPQQLIIDAIKVRPTNSLGICTADLSAHFTTLPLPAAADEKAVLHVTVDGHTIDLPRL